jgi:hypothetical protein
LIGTERERIIERLVAAAACIHYRGRQGSAKGALAAARAMCDYFLQRMEGDQAGGDLTDIVRAGGGAMPGNAEVPSTAAEWQLQGEPMLFPPPPSSSDGCAGGAGADVFGDPFAALGDPFSSDYASGVDFLDAMPDAMAKVGFDTAVGGGSGCGGGGGGGGQLLDMSRKPLLPRGVQMPSVGVLAPRVLPSPLSPRAIRPYPALAGDMVKLGITAGQVAGCAIDAAVVGMQMSSPRAAGGIKRRLADPRGSSISFVASCCMLHSTCTAGVFASS